MAAWLLPLAKPSCALLSSVAARALLPGSLPHAATAAGRTDHSSCDCPRCRGCLPRRGSTTATAAHATPGTSGPATQAHGSAGSNLHPAGCTPVVGSAATSSICMGARIWGPPNTHSVRRSMAPAATAAAISAWAPAAAARASAAVGQAGGIHTGAAQAAQAAHVSDYCDDLEEQEGRWRDAQATAAVYHDVRNALAANAVSPSDAELRGVMAPQYLQTPGGRVAYHSVPPAADALHAPGVIFCGGLLSSMDGTKATFLEMHARRRGHPFLRFDYRGHGASDGQFEDTTLGDWYEDTVAMIDHASLQGEQHVLVGSSIGAWIALKAAASRREVIKGVVLMAPAVDITELWWDNMSGEEQREARATGFVALRKSTEEGARVRVSFFDEASDHCILDVAQRDLQVRCPVRIFHGAQDVVVPPFVAQEVVNWLESRDVHLTMVQDGDHRLSRPEDLRSLMTSVEELLEINTQRART